MQADQNAKILFITLPKITNSDEPNENLIIYMSLRSTENGDLL